MQPKLATILIVEDHRGTSTFLADNLSADGYEPLQADCAADAKRLMETHYPDLAIVDLGLPDRDGLELVREVRQTDRVATRLDPDMPMLILSGRAGELDRLRGFERGCDDYVVKPSLPFPTSSSAARFIAGNTGSYASPVDRLQPHVRDQQVALGPWCVGLMHHAAAAIIISAPA